MGRNVEEPEPASERPEVAGPTRSWPADVTKIPPLATPPRAAVGTLFPRVLQTTPLLAQSFLLLPGGAWHLDAPCPTAVLMTPRPPPSYILCVVSLPADEGFGDRVLGGPERSPAPWIVEPLPGARTKIPTSRERAELD